MKGNNELRINQATMIEALQMWLASQMAGATPKVTSVIPDNSIGYQEAVGFIVKLQSDEDNPA